MLGPRCCRRAFSSCSERGLLSRCGVRAFHCGGFSCCRAQALGGAGSVVVGHGFSRSAAWKDLPGPGSEPVSPALAGGFLTTGPLARSPDLSFGWISSRGEKSFLKKNTADGMIVLFIPNICFSSVLGVPPREPLPRVLPGGRTDLQPTETRVHRVTFCVLWNVYSCLNRCFKSLGMLLPLLCSFCHKTKIGAPPSLYHRRVQGESWCAANTYMSKK